MSDRAHAIAIALVRSGVHLGAGVDRPSSLLDWISAFAAADSSRYRAARATFDAETLALDSVVNTCGHQMAFELSRSGYELGVYVGLRLARSGWRQSRRHPRMGGRRLRKAVIRQR